MASSANIRYHARTHIGLIRKVNEDRFLVIDRPKEGFAPHAFGLVFAVADGMGGHAAGDVASRMACEGLLPGYAEKVRSEPWPISARSVLRQMEKTFFDLDRQIRSQGLADPACADMGTTLSVMAIVGDQAVVVHVGDSRIYRLRMGRLERLTTDHTFVQEMIDEGEVDPADAPLHPLRHVLTRVLGTPEPLEEAFTALNTVEPGDIYLLCSDGLHAMLPDGAILQTLLKPPERSRAPDRLVDLALANGGKDNVTVIVVEIGDSLSQEQEKA